jgi:hypothetical protein
MWGLPAPVVAALGYQIKEYLNLWKMPLCGKNKDYFTGVTCNRELGF